jgi:hypothetical protein
MEAQFFCADCRCEHAEPADAILGHLVICVDCAIVRDLVNGRFDVPCAEPPLAA